MMACVYMCVCMYVCIFLPQVQIIFFLVVYCLIILDVIIYMVYNGLELSYTKSYSWMISVRGKNKTKPKTKKKQTFSHMTRECEKACLLVSIGPVDQVFFVHFIILSFQNSCQYLN